MHIETSSTGIVLIILVMLLVTLIMRFAGPFLMARVTINPRVESFIGAMASSVLIAIIVPMAVIGDAGARAALFTTAVLMLVTGKALPAISAGLIAAALVRYL